jgi:CDP-6-deoxy-D-xylo-4-hexulose-3-dehydrase
MFENKTEQQAREEILAMVEKYCDTFHNQTKNFEKGDRIPYARRVYG